MPTAKKQTAYDNLALYKRRGKTDPKHVKHVDQRGGFHTIRAASQKKAATEEWGPQGGLWGLKSCKYSYLRDANGNPLELCLEADFYYPDGDYGPGGVLEGISSDLPWRSNGECRKKIRTDVITKALSELGFNDDVFQDEFGDNRYLGDQGSPASAPKPRYDDPPKPNAQPVEEGWLPSNPKYYPSSQYAGKCKICDEWMPVGSKIVWAKDPNNKTWTAHQKCFESVGGSPPSDGGAPKKLEKAAPAQEYLFGRDWDKMDVEMLMDEGAEVLKEFGELDAVCEIYNNEGNPTTRKAMIVSRIKACEERKAGGVL